MSDDCGDYITCMDDLEDAYEELRRDEKTIATLRAQLTVAEAERDALREQTRWISVEERDPDVNAGTSTYYLVVMRYEDDDGHISNEVEMLGYEYEWEYERNHGLYYKSALVTHWRPLPTPPANQ